MEDTRFTWDGRQARQLAWKIFAMQCAATSGVLIVLRGDAPWSTILGIGVGATVISVGLLLVMLRAAGQGRDVSFTADAIVLEGPTPERILWASIEAAWHDARVNAIMGRTLPEKQRFMVPLRGFTAAEVERMRGICAQRLEGRFVGKYQQPIG